MGKDVPVSPPTCPIHGCYLTSFGVRWPERKRDNEHSIDVCLLCLRDLVKIEKALSKDDD